MLCFLSWWVLKVPGKVRTRQPHMCTWKNSFFSITLSVTPHRASHMLPLRPKRCYFDRTSTSDFESYINKLAKIICWGSPPRVTIVQRHPQKNYGHKDAFGTPERLMENLISWAAARDTKRLTTSSRIAPNMWPSCRSYGSAQQSLKNMILTWNRPI